MKTKHATFCVGDFFETRRGSSKFKRDYAVQHPGDYPVYSARRDGPLCHIDTYQYDGRYLTWTANGYAGYMQVLEGRFSINGDRGILVPKDKEQCPIDLDYLRIVLEPELRNMGVGRLVPGRKNEYTKIRPSLVEQAPFTCPVRTDGTIDMDEQRRLVRAFLRTEERLREVKGLTRQIDNTSVVIPVEGETRRVYLSDEDLFSLSIGKRELKSSLHEDGGDGRVPVYSANVNKPLGYTDESVADDFSKPSLLWGIDGIFDWGFIEAGKPFVHTDHCGKLKILEETIDPLYAFFALKATRYEYGFNRAFRASLTNMKEYVGFDVPVDGSGSFDLATQKEIAESYLKANNILMSLSAELKLISHKKVTAF